MADQQTAVRRLPPGRFALAHLARQHRGPHGPSSGHAVRVGQMAACTAAALGWEGPEVDRLAATAPLHDIGKVAVPAHILAKPGPLTAAERRAVRRHVWVGAQMVSADPSPLWLMARDICLYHHERWDGTGYLGIDGPAIPLAARIVAVADVYDALASERSYKRAWPHDRCMAHLADQRGRHFDPDAVDAVVQAGSWRARSAHAEVRSGA